MAILLLPDISSSPPPSPVINLSVSQLDPAAQCDTSEEDTQEETEM